MPPFGKIVKKCGKIIDSLRVRVCAETIMAKWISGHFFYARARNRFCRASPSVLLPWENYDFLPRGESPALRNFDLLALVVPLPVAAVTETDQIDPSRLVVPAQCQIRTLPNRMYMVDGYAPSDPRRDLMLTVPAPVTLLLPDSRRQRPPFPGDVKRMEVSRRNQRQDPGRRP